MSIHGYIMYSIPSIAVLVGRKRIEILVCCVKALSYIEKKKKPTTEALVVTARKFMVNGEKDFLSCIATASAT